MAFNLSADQQTEIEKVLRYVKQMEGIIRTSPSQEQKARVSKELSKYRARLGELVPGFQPGAMTADQIRVELGLDDPQPAASGARSSGGQGRGRSGGGSPHAGEDYRVIDKFPIQRASPNCGDPDVNFLATILQAINTEYWPALSEQHSKLDFSHSSERDTLRAHLENLSRNMKVLLETIEEYAGAEKQDFREQLLKMKNRQTRAFIYDSNDVFKKLREFLEKLAEDVSGRGGIVMNKNEPLKFNSRFESATLLENRSVADGILEFYQLVVEAIEHLNLPSLRKSEDRPGA